MKQRKVVPVLVHGANQTAKAKDPDRTYEERNIDAWEKALNEAPEVLAVLQGGAQEEIEEYHGKHHADATFPLYEFNGARKHAVWYGDAWEEFCWNEVPDGDGGHHYKLPRPGSLVEKYEVLECLRKHNKDDKLIAGEQRIIDKFFAELTPFYELAVLSARGTTLYGEICDRFLDDLAGMTAGGEENFLLIAHSMGCAVSYNVMSHVAAAQKGQSPVAEDVKGALSRVYVSKVQEFAKRPGRCVGLVTFGNYIGYNYAQRLNNYILSGSFAKRYPYPASVTRWRNFYTAYGGDPYIIDDKLISTITGSKKGQYKDVRVSRIPFKNIGHGRDKWFKRSDFEDDLKKVLIREMYLDA